MEYSTPQSGILNMLSLDGNNKTNLAEAARWAKFLGILQLVALGLFILLGVGISFFANGIIGDALPGMSALGIGMLYVLIGIVSLYPAWSLYKFGQLTRQGVQQENQTLFGEGILYLKRFFKFIGILAIIVIGLYLIVIVAAIAAGTFMG